MEFSCPAVSGRIPSAGMGRVSWQDLPAAVRCWTAEVLGSPVAGAVSQPGGVVTFTVRVSLSAACKPSAISVCMSASFF